jgi:hypothetical protein
MRLGLRTTRSNSWSCPQRTSRPGTFSRATFNHRDDGFDLNSPSVGLAAKADLQQSEIIAVGRPCLAGKSERLVSDSRDNRWLLSES